MIESERDLWEKAFHYNWAYDDQLGREDIQKEADLHAFIWPKNITTRMTTNHTVNKTSLGGGKTASNDEWLLTSRGEANNIEVCWRLPQWWWSSSWWWAFNKHCLLTYFVVVVVKDKQTIRKTVIIFYILVPNSLTHSLDLHRPGHLFAIFYVIRWSSSFKLLRLCKYLCFTLYDFWICFPPNIVFGDDNLNINKTKT